MLLPFAPWDGSFCLRNIYVKQEDVNRSWPAASVNKLPSATDKTGAPGRPSSKHLVEAEFKRLCSIGELESTLGAQAKRLSNWLKTGQPRLAQMKPKTIETLIRVAYRSAKPRN